MAIIHICDRCGAASQQLGANMPLALGPNMPSTNPVRAPFTFDVTVSSVTDLCVPCQVSAMVTAAFGLSPLWFVTAIAQIQQDAAAAAAAAKLA